MIYNMKRQQFPEYTLFSFVLTYPIICVNIQQIVNSIYLYTTFALHLVKKHYIYI
jgi:hypothetical protein